MHIIQANLQRSKLATTELLQGARERGISIALIQEPYVGRSGEMKLIPGTKIIQCTLKRQKPVKAAIIIFDDRLGVIHDPQLVTETEVVVLLKAGKLRLGLVSVYYEGDQDIEPYLVRTKVACQKLQTENLLVGGDVNAWSHWWGSSHEDQRGAAYNAFLNEMDLHILNTGDTPTFETYRRDKKYTSVVDVTACSLSVLGRIDDWKVDRGLTTSDHNAITFTLHLDEQLTPLESNTTRKYNTKKANWQDFKTILKISLAEKNITPGTIDQIFSQEDLEAKITVYTEAILDACDKSIPKVGIWKANSRPPWWSKTLENLKRDVLRKKRRIRNAAPIRMASVIKEYCTAKQEYVEMTIEAQTSSWKEFCSTQEKESLWDGIYRVIRKTARRQEDTLLRSG